MENDLSHIYKIREILKFYLFCISSRIAFDLVGWFPCFGGILVDSEPIRQAQGLSSAILNATRCWGLYVLLNCFRLGL